MKSELMTMQGSSEGKKPGNYVIIFFYAQISSIESNPPTFGFGLTTGMFLISW